MKKEKVKVCSRIYWSKNLRFPNTTLRIPMVSQPLTNQSNQITFHNGCPSCQQQLKRVDYCPVCSEQLRKDFASKTGITSEQLNEYITNGFMGKTVSSDETIKLHTIGNEVIVFTKQELETIKTATEDMIAIGYGKMETINPQHIDNCYALLPDLEETDDGNYRRLLFTLQRSHTYLVVQYADRGNTHNAVLIAYHDTVTSKDFLMLVNTQESKDLNIAVVYEPKVMISEQETNQVYAFLTSALPNKDFTSITENEIEKKKQKLIAMKLSGQPIMIEDKTEKLLPNINGFAVALKELETQIEAHAK